MICRLGSLSRFAFVAVLAFVAGAMVVAAAAANEAGGGDCAAPVECNPCGPAWTTVEKTVMVPVVHWETRAEQVTRYRPEAYERTITVQKPVYETKTMERVQTVYRTETRMRTETHRVCKPVWSTVEREFTAMVPHTVVETGYRTECRMVPVKTTRTVTVDKGCWVACENCDPCLPPQRVWKPNCVTVEVPCVTWKPTTVQVPFQYPVTVCKPITVTRKVPVCELTYEDQTREVPYTVCIPEEKVERVEVPTCRYVAEERKVACTRMVPYTEEVTVKVPVCKWEPRTVTCRVPCW